MATKTQKRVETRGELPPDEKPKRKRVASRLPPGVTQDEYGYFIMVPSGHHDEKGESIGQKRMEVIIHADPNLGRAIANRRDCYYWDEELGGFLYRGLKWIGKSPYEGRGPEPPRSPELYTMKYPGYSPVRRRRMAEEGTGPGRVEMEIPFGDDDGYDPGKKEEEVDE